LLQLGAGESRFGRAGEAFQFFPSCCLAESLRQLTEAVRSFQFFPSCCLYEIFSALRGPDIPLESFNSFPVAAAKNPALQMDLTLMSRLILSILSQLLPPLIQPPAPDERVDLSILSQLLLEPTLSQSPPSPRRLVPPFHLQLSILSQLLPCRTNTLRSEIGCAFNSFPVAAC
jgi:hypothetical protein